MRSNKDGALDKTAVPGLRRFRRDPEDRNERRGSGCRGAATPKKDAAVSCQRLVRGRGRNSLAGNLAGSTGPAQAAGDDRRRVSKSVRPHVKKILLLQHQDQGSSLGQAGRPGLLRFGTHSTQYGCCWHRAAKETTAVHCERFNARRSRNPLARSLACAHCPQKYAEDAVQTV